MFLSVSIYLCRYRIIRIGLGSVRRRDRGEGRGGRGGGLFAQLCQSQTQQCNAGCYYFVCGVVVLISHLPLLGSAFSENNNNNNNITFIIPIYFKLQQCYRRYENTLVMY